MVLDSVYVVSANTELHILNCVCRCETLAAVASCHLRLEMQLSVKHMKAIVFEQLHVFSSSAFTY